MVNDPPSDLSPRTYSDIFKEHFPYYLAIGMTPHQFWDEDPSLAEDYRKAAEIELERKNQLLWLQGMYVYQGVLAASPVFRTFAKRGTKPLPYMDRPISLTERENEVAKEQSEKDTMEKGKAFMTAFAMQHNKQYHKDGGDVK